MVQSQINSLSQELSHEMREKVYRNKEIEFSGSVKICANRENYYAMCDNYCKLHEVDESTIW